MVDFKIEWDIESLRPWRSGKVDDALLFAAKRAGGDAFRRARTEFKRGIKRRKTLKDMRIADALFIKYPKSEKSLDDLVWRLNISDKAFPLSYFAYRQKVRSKTVTDSDGNKSKVRRNAGLTVEVNRGQREVLRHAFVLTMDSGHVGIFERGPGRKRLPLRKLFSSRVSDTASDDGFMEALRTKSQEVFSSTFARLFAMRMSKL